MAGSAKSTSTVVADQVHRDRMAESMTVRKSSFGDGEEWNPNAPRSLLVLTSAGVIADGMTTSGS